MQSEVSLTPDNERRNAFRMRGGRILLGLVALLMVSDFVVRGLALAFEPAKNDISDVYVGAWLWRHGLNFYDSELATRTQEQLVHASVQIAPVYPPTAFVLVSPLTFLPWGWANFVWLSLGLAGIGATVVLLLRLRGSGAWDLRTLGFAVLLLSFSPLHQAFHAGNAALLAVPLCLWAILLAEKGQDLGAGLILGATAALKPQLAIWILVYYLLRRRPKLIFAAVVVGVTLTAIFLVHAVPLATVVSSYRSNLRFWYAPGRPAGFTEGAVPFHISMIQVILYRLTHSVFVSNLMAYAIFASGFVLWLLILWRARFRTPATLAIASLLALGFLSFYHSVSDVTILTLALCWAIPAEGQPWTRAQISTCVLFLLLMLPGHSALIRVSPLLSVAITTQWLWALFIARYFIWLLLALNFVLLFSLWVSARSIRERVPV